MFLVFFLQIFGSTNYIYVYLKLIIHQLLHLTYNKVGGGHLTHFEGQWGPTMTTFLVKIMPQ